MTLPKLSISVEKGGLGGVPTSQDGIAAMIHTGVAISGKLKLKEPYSLFSLADAEALGINKTDHPRSYHDISSFFETAGEGSELWILWVGETETFTNILGTTSEIAKKLVEGAGGRIRLLGISHLEKSGGSVVAASEGLKGKIHDAVPLAQAFASYFAKKNQPLHIILSGNELTSLTDLKDYSSASHTRVSLLIGGTQVGTKAANLGLVLGQLSGLPVQRSLARVKNGSLPVSKATFSNGEIVEKHVGKFENLHAKRYLFLRTYIGQVGYFFADDLNLSSASEDISTIADSRVIDKVIRLAYQTYVTEIGEEISVDENGKLAQAHIKYLEGKMENVLNETMTSKGEISQAIAFIDPDQNVLSTNEVEVIIQITKVGYAKNITIKIGFINPQISS
ncbi:MAG: DUF2586 family protein [Cytophagales bacterium]|nr:DUF2586 family protein [Cytophagales bacterium]